MSSQIDARGRHINIIISLLVGGLLGWTASMLSGTDERPEHQSERHRRNRGRRAWRMAPGRARRIITIQSKQKFVCVLLLVSLLGGNGPTGCRAKLLRDITERQGGAAPHEA